jgi:hypothetical protein
MINYINYSNATSKDQKTYQLFQFTERDLIQTIFYKVYKPAAIDFGLGRTPHRLALRYYIEPLIPSNYVVARFLLAPIAVYGSMNRYARKFVSTV